MHKKKRSITIQIIGKVAQAYLGPGSYDAEATHDHGDGSLRLNAEYMLNPGTDFRPRSIPLLFPTRQLFMTGAFALKMLSIAPLRHGIYSFLRTIRRIGPDIPAGILWIKQLFKDIAVMHFGAAYFVAPYQLVFHIRGDMVLVAEEALPVFLRPAGRNIFLAAFVLIPVFGLFPFFYLLILVAAIALYRHSNNTGINDLSFLSPENGLVDGQPLMQSKR